MARRQKLSASLEDYLEAIYHIVNEKRAAKAKDISQRLGVRSSSVTGALKSLSVKGLVNYAPYDLITLTPEGTRLAKDVVTRHEALKDFFITVLSVDNSDAEDTACKMEHVISPTILERLVEFVEFMKTCPIAGTTWVENEGFKCEPYDDSRKSGN
jgi:DtxR family Mn-dependent transcriptional regulator